MSEKNVRWNLYPRLAISGISKNRRLYFPYIYTCIGMVFMFYILSFLTYTNALDDIEGGDTLKLVLQLGAWVVAIFAVIFLFYTNSFLTRRRKKEFGLLNILGMNKGNISRIIVWETMITGVISIAAGLFAGVLLSKLVLMCLADFIDAQVDYGFWLPAPALRNTLILFVIIFMLIFINTLRQIRMTNAINLLKSESAGEKAPKANWFLGLAGVVILVAAYIIAVRVKEPIAALTTFFTAVIMVIIATYLIFISGSVLMCKILQKNKGYYYKPNHFVSVSSMTYRMKRNGAGLASICILLTMVFVMLSSTACLYIGVDESIMTGYPRNIYVSLYVDDIDSLKSDELSQFKNEIISLIDSQTDEKNVQEYEVVKTYGCLDNGSIEINYRNREGSQTSNVNSVIQVLIMSVDEYNRQSGASETLNADEALVCGKGYDYKEDRIAFNRGGSYKVKRVVKDFIDNYDTSMKVVPTLVVIVPDVKAAVAPLENETTDLGQKLMMISWNYGFDTDAGYDSEIAIKESIRVFIQEQVEKQRGGFHGYSIEGAASERADFYRTYGGLFFIAVILSVVFAFAAVLIIYYKQISEGYEDRARFMIMQKVGMTKQVIKKSINSQMLTVFLLPLVFSALHLLFAFPMIRKLLILFNLTNTKLLITTTIISFLSFAVLYVLIYRATSKVYYDIVSK